MENKISLKTWLEQAKAGAFQYGDRDTQIKAGWYDWFCRDESLGRRLKAMMPKVVRITKSAKIDQEKTYIFFKNNCPMNGSLYDDFRICDLETGDVIYTICPRSGHKSLAGKSEVWGRENDFDGPLVSGQWSDVKKFFGV